MHKPTWHHFYCCFPVICTNRPIASHHTKVGVIKLLCSVSRRVNQCKSRWVYTMHTQTHRSFCQVVPAIHRQFRNLVAVAVVRERCTTSIQGRQPNLAIGYLHTASCTPAESTDGPNCTTYRGLCIQPQPSSVWAVISMIEVVSRCHWLVPSLSNLKRETGLISYTVDLTRQTPCQARVFHDRLPQQFAFGTRILLEPRAVRP